jgi:hypothetical protein
LAHAAAVFLFSQLKKRKPAGLELHMVKKLENGGTSAAV